jgi:NitT/TauT family transport system permease protein
VRFSAALKVLSFLGLIALWQGCAVWVADPRLFPGPVAVAGAFAAESHHGVLLHHLLATLSRVAASFVVAMVIGTAVGLAMGRSRIIDSLFDGWLILFLNLPALVVIVLAYVWFGLTEAAAVGAVAVNKIPSVVATVREGARALDRSLIEMAEVYKLGWRRTLIHVVLPQLVPYFLVSTRTGLSLIWKIVLVVEMIGRSDGVGFQIHTYFQLFDVARILAYSLAFIAVVQVLETGVIAPLERHLTRWRR